MATNTLRLSHIIRAVTLASFTLATPFAFSATLDKTVEQGVKRVEQAKSSQEKVESVDKEVRNLEREYRAIAKEIEGLDVYVSQLNRQLDAQDKELTAIEKSMQDAALVERQMAPLMSRMIDSINQFVAADMPFLKEERTTRVESLTELMGRSDVTAAEKYRKVMAAYQAEVDYGRTIESYRGTLDTSSDAAKEVDFLRIGRIALVYQSLDGNELGIWNKSSTSWEPLDPSYKSKIMAGIRIAREQSAPSLIKVPVPAPQMSSSTQGNR